MWEQKPSFHTVTVVVFEDFSAKMIGKEERAHLGQDRGVVFLPSPERNMGAAYGKWALHSYIKEHARPNDYYLHLDGDDLLADAHVLFDLRVVLIKHKPWVLHGVHNGPYSSQCGGLTKTSGRFSPREQWFNMSQPKLFCPPHVVSCHLLQHLSQGDAQDRGGHWLRQATDAALLLPVLEVAGPRRTFFWNARPTYNYTMHEKTRRENYSAREAKLSKHAVRTAKRRSEAANNHVLNIVVCSYKRPLAAFLERVARSDLRKTGLRALRVHLCLNDPASYLSSEAIASRLSTQKATFLTYRRDNRYQALERFMLAREVYAREPLDYVMIVDDDQYVRKHTIGDTWRARQPNSVVSWFGKTWFSVNVSVNSSSGRSANSFSYWRPDFWASHGTFRQRSIKLWEYVGPGLAILDARIFAVPELYRPEFADVDDLWLTFISHKLGWPLWRLFTTFNSAVNLSKTGMWTSLQKRKEQVAEDLLVKCRLLRWTRHVSSNSTATSSHISLNT